MARGLTTVDVEGRRYEISNLDPFVSQRIFIRLAKMVAPSAGKALDGLNLDSDLGGEAFGKMLEAFADRVDEAELERTSRELLNVVLHEGKKVIPDLHFAGDVPHMFAVLAKVLEVEYGGFLPFVRSLVSRAKAASPSQSQSPKT